MKALLFCCVAGVILACTLGQRSKGSSTPLPGSSVNPLVGEEEGRIWHGFDAKLGQFPYQVLLNAISSDQRSYALCGGSIISSTWVLTAGHCTYNQTNIIIYMGLIDPSLKSSSTKQTASKIIIHPQYDPKYLYNDISLLQVPKAIVFNTNIQPIKLPPNAAMNATYWDNKSAVVSGWGKTVQSENGEHKPLQYTNLIITPQAQCKTIYQNYPFTNNNLCNKKVVNTTSWTGPCQGDSGGPLAAMSVLAGLVSWGVGDCGNTNPDVFVNVGSYLDFIKQYSGVTN